jgi:hypothetical protein
MGPVMANETDVMRSLQKLATMLTARLFRNNTGMAWQGQVRKNRDGSITISDPRPLHAGLVVGGSDLIGWLPVRITQEMVGDTIAVFTAVEVKAGTKASPEQLAFIAAVKKAGGRAGIARTENDLSEILLS